MDVEIQRAPDAAVRADRLGDRLLGLVPRSGGPHVVLGLEHQCAGRAHADAVAAVHTGGIGERDGLVKIVAERDGPILGVHIAGPWATELIAEGYLAVNWEATAADIATYIHPHPTLSEVFGEAALTLTGRSLDT